MKRIRKSEKIIKSIISILFLLLIFSAESCSCSGPEEIKSSNAQVMAEDIIKQYLKNSDDADIEIRNIIDNGDSSFTVSMRTKNKNDFGGTIVSYENFTLRYKKGEWTDLKNWEYSDIKISNDNTGEVRTIFGNM